MYFRRDALQMLSLPVLRPGGAAHGEADDIHSFSGFGIEISSIEEME
jgi:hypothetical protein